MWSGGTDEVRIRQRSGERKTTLPASIFSALKWFIMCCYWIRSRAGLMVAWTQHGHQTHSIHAPVHCGISFIDLWVSLDHVVTHTHTCTAIILIIKIKRKEKLSMIQWVIDCASQLWLNVRRVSFALCGKTHQAASNQRLLKSIFDVRMRCCEWVLLFQIRSPSRCDCWKNPVFVIKRSIDNGTSGSKGHVLREEHSFGVVKHSLIS